jgi:hypothetical protein
MPSLLHESRPRQQRRWRRQERYDASALLRRNPHPLAPVVLAATTATPAGHTGDTGSAEGDAHGCDHLVSGRAGSRPRDLHGILVGGLNPFPQRPVVVERPCAVKQSDASQEDSRESSVGRGRDAAGSHGEERVVAVVMRNIDIAAEPHPQPLLVEGGCVVITLP